MDDAGCVMRKNNRNNIEISVETQNFASLQKVVIDTAWAQARGLYAVRTTQPEY